ncbi:MAG: FAD-dependent oxidoreductase [Chloroflexi bacterium]|nr:FAD-dependent oxidoreductase [Chloroflexota bacterium]
MAGNEIVFKINGREVRTQAGTTVLRAAQETGIYIPGLCDHPDLAPAGVCGLCVVEIEGRDDFPLSCMVPAADGMAVNSETPAVQNLRRQALHHILAEHPHDCLTCWRKVRCGPSDICLRTTAVTQHCVYCNKNYHCELQKAADYMCTVKEEIPYRFKGYDIFKDNPYYDRDYNYCIVCGRCIRACRDLRGIGVYKFDMDEKPTEVMTVKGGSTQDSGCKFCFACVEVCPVAAIMDKKPYQTIYARGEAYVVPCRDACPAHIDIPRYLYYIAQGRYSEALAVNREKIPFPGSLGRVCVHFCEQSCRRDVLNEPIAIKELKRVCADLGNESWKHYSKVAPPTGKKVAVVGAGPGGLTAAFYLAKKGHAVTVFEALPECGGMMRYGIPEYRLPRDILKYEVDLIREVGVDIKTNSKIESVDTLMKQGFDAAVLAIGAHQGMKMGVEGEDLPGVMDGASFLREVNLGKAVKTGDKVAVIGGGNSAIDSARVALRVGAKEVSIIYRRTRAEMPAAEEEIEDALQEGIKIEFLAAPSKIVPQNGKLGLECIRMRLGAPDASGRRSPEPVKGSEYMTEFDSVIASIGQAPDVPKEFGVKTGRGNRLGVDEKTLQTSVKGVFAAGDAVTGPASVIEAIAAARKAASSVDKYLGGDGNIEETLVPVEEFSPLLVADEDFDKWEREEGELIPLAERLQGFKEVKLAMTEERAKRQAARCFRCDLRLKINTALQPAEDIRESCLVKFK